MADENVSAGPPAPTPPPRTTGINIPSTQISLNPAARAQGRAAGRQAETGKGQEEPKDNFREVVETIVFVVVLVLMLKTFLAEAFVIPTGSMATTLLGYHYQVTCEQCKYRFPVNASTEADPQDGPPQPVYGCTCPNCGAENVLRPELGGRRP
jgi:hypothetical protein